MGLKMTFSPDLNELWSLCFYSRTSGQHEDAIEEHQMELQLGEALAQDLDVGVAHRKIGECHMHLGDFDKALRHQRDYLRIAAACDSVVEQQRAQATIGHTYLQQVGGKDGGICTQ